MHRESANINTALMALKDCFRCFQEQHTSGAAVRVPFRASKLTQMLREGFSDPSHSTTIISCEPRPLSS